MKPTASIFEKPLGGGGSLILLGSVFTVFGIAASFFFFILTGTWFGLVPLIFTVVGLVVRRKGRLMNAQRQIPSPASGRPDWLPVSKHRVEGGRVLLNPALTPRAALALTIFFALFWNGIVSVFVVMAIRSHLEGEPEWFLTVFVIPFILVGLVAIGLVVRQFLALFNPTIEMTVNRAEAEPGDSLYVSWKIHGDIHRLKKLKIMLVGEESSTYRRGTDTITDRYEFSSFRIHESEQVFSMNSARVTIPAETMHSFKTLNNGIQWKLKVQGEIPRWPDIEAEYEFIVKPREGNHG